jgi:hypothetical protein
MINVDSEFIIQREKISRVSGDKEWDKYMWAHLQVKGVVLSVRLHIRVFLISGPLSLLPNQLLSHNGPLFKIVLCLVLNSVLPLGKY